ncbi:MAG TPA: histidine kinase, partial [Bacteroidetes bacterium]|nr:histidine kinase [Bacteroidota bacterium]
LEEEKMAVIVQKMVGRAHQDRFYPDFAGVAKSYNFYPLPPQTPSDGIVSVALGLGKWVVDGGNSVRFCSKYPTDLIQFYSAEETLNTTQRGFFALQLQASSDFGIETHDMMVKQFDLDVAEQDGTLHIVGSTYSPEDDVINDGLSRKGIRLVTFGPVLHHRLFPLSQIVELLTDMGTWGMGTPVEIEFAVNISPDGEKAKEFGMLQMRPLVLSREAEELNIEDLEPQKCICYSQQVLGNGVIRDIYDIVVVDVHKFDRAKSLDVANEVMHFNEQLLSENRPYLLVGVGRWGTLDPWLGIPIRWDQISGARAIVEGAFRDMDVAPSQGSHFFQNITSFRVGYFTVNSMNHQGFIDWDWLSAQEPVEELAFTRHLRFDNPMTVKINGHQNIGIISKPGK